MVEEAVGNPHAHDREYRSFTLIDMIHVLEVGSVGSVQLTLTRAESGSKLAKRRIFAEIFPKTHPPLPLLHPTTLQLPLVSTTRYVGTNVDLIDIAFGLFPVT